jgi:hypothetical protein
MPRKSATEAGAIQELQESRVREVLQAARKEEKPARPLKLEIQRRYSDKLMQSLFPGPRQLDDLDEVRARSQAEMRAGLKQHKAAAVRRSAANGALLRSQLETWRRTRELLAVQNAAPNLNFNFVILDTPALILPSQDVNLVQVSPAPWNNVARLTAGWSSPYSDDGNDTLSYVFAWRNPSDRSAVINVASYLMLNGYCDAGAGPGFTHSDLLVTTRLNVFEWWNNPATNPPYQTGQINYSLPFLEAYGGGVFGVGDFETMEITGNYDVEYRMFAVPPHEVAVFTVDLTLGHFIIGDGYIDVDFASGGFEIMCPALLIGILT